MTDIGSRNGVTLASPGYSSATSFTITNGAVVTYTSAQSNRGAVYGDSSAAWTVTNYGTVTGAGVADGILLGTDINRTNFQVTVINQGTISGANYGVQVYNSLASPAYIENAASYTIQGQGGIYIAGAGSVTNHGVISGTALYGVRLTGGGSVSNDGTIQGVQAGVDLNGSTAGAVTNSGLITASAGNYVVNFGAGGSINNTGTIQGHSGVQLGAAGTVTNEGSIIANVGYGIRLQAGGVVVNTGTIQGGILVAGGVTATVTNGGTINAGSNSYAVYFAVNNASSTLIVDPGASFTGGNGIYGGGATIELAAGDGGTLGGFGVSIKSFNTLNFAANADWTVSAAYGSGGSGFGGMAITGFLPGDTIELTGVALNQATSYNPGGTGLYVNNGAGAGVYLNIQGGVNELGAFMVSNDGSNTFIVDCFASGTRITTPDGAVRVENLAAGDLVTAHFSGTARIEWIGRRHLDCTRHPDPRKVWPVRVAAGTFGPSQPSRDLTLSPNHAVYVRGELIPVSYLINGTSIVQITMDEIIYYHIELAEHDLLLAEGLLAESYLDVGDRANFANGAEHLRLFPDFATTSPDVAAAWETRGCAPLILRGPRLEAVRSWLNETAFPQLLAAAA